MVHKTQMASRPISRQIIKTISTNLRKKIPREVAVVKLKPAESRRLNLIYRNKNTPTSVLSFRYGPGYGEILLCPEIIKKEAKKAGNSRRFQMTWMIVHGMLHLAEIHHEKSAKDAKKAEKLEKDILKKLGF